VTLLRDFDITEKIRVNRKRSKEEKRDNAHRKLPRNDHNNFCAQSAPKCETFSISGVVNVIFSEGHAEKLVGVLSTSTKVHSNIPF
jgi:hypothetical protein